MNKIRVLQFSITNTGGGVTQYILENWKHIDHRRFQFDFVTFSPQLDYEDELLKEGCRVYHIKNRAEENLESFKNEIRHVLENGYDIIHLHTNFWKSLQMENLAKEAKIPKIIIHAHNSGVYEDRNREEKIKQHNLIKSQIDETIATDFWACSWKAAAFLYGDRISQQKIQIMNNAIDVNKFRFDMKARNRYRKELGLENEFVIGHVGRFSYQKNHKFLLDVFQKISQKRQNARLILIGKGPLEDDIRIQAERYGIENKVMFLGKHDDVNLLYNAMDVFCLPSFFEGFPIVAVEAQANGLRCLCSSEITDEIALADKISFLPIDEGDKVLWEEKLAEMQNNEENRGKIERKIEEQFDIKTQIIQLEKLYME